MSTIVKTGWLNDKNGDKFAPKTLTSQVQTSDGILLEDKIQADIQAATVASQKYVDEAIANNVPNIDFTGYATEDFVKGSIDSVKKELSESIVAESDEWKVVDEAGNIIFSVDATGAHTTELTLNGKSVGDIAEEKITSLVDSAPDTLNTLNELAAALGDDPNFATTVATKIGKKVDKVDGKDLSTNDFTNEYKEKLDGLENIVFITITDIDNICGTTIQSASEVMF